MHPDRDRRDDGHRSSSAFVVAWRRHPGHPILLMVLATTLLVWQDPIMNWAPYAVYNPQLWHWPETWPLVSLSPTVEPFIVIGYATFYLAPFFPAIWILRRLQRAATGRVVRVAAPALSLAALILVIGFVFDAFLEIFLVRTQLYIYSQVIPFGSSSPGKWYQFPLHLGVGAGDVGDDPGRRPALPRRHRQDAGREARPAGPLRSGAVPRSARSS